MAAPEGDGIPALPGEDSRAEAETCTCCGGAGEHRDGHECYVCDASGLASAQAEGTNDGEAVCEGHHGRLDEGLENAKDRYGPDYRHFAARLTPEQNRLFSLAFSDGYEGVTHSGIALVAVATGRVLLAQRAMDDTDAPDVQETWEFPGGGLNEGEEPFPGAVRELMEETYLPLPDGMVVNGWRAGPTDNYQGFVYRIEDEFDLTGWQPTTEVQALAWVDLSDTDLSIRPEMADFDLTLLDVSGNEEQTMTAVATEAPEPEYTPGEFDLDGPIPVHGVVAPEEMSSGDKRAFAKGAMTKRPLRIPFSDQHVSIGGHDGSVVVGSVDRMMRKDGLIHWEGALMASADAEPLVARMEFFDGRYGVSVDGDQGSMDEARTEETGTLWFDSVRAAGLTAVAIPAFHEAYVAFGPHPEMPADEDETLTAAAYESGDLIGGTTFKRGAGWVTDPVETRRIHAYWTKKGEPGYAKIGWGTRGDFTRAKKLIGAKIAEHSPDKMRFLNQIIAQWHFDALGYWPGDLDKPGNKTSAEARAEREAKLASGTVVAAHEEDPDELDEAEPDAAGLTDAIESVDGLEAVDDSEEDESIWEAVLVSSVSGNPVRPPVEYFHEHPSSEATVIEEPDANGFRRTHGFVAEWGVCHIGMDGQCVEPPLVGSDDYPEFHLGRTKVSTDGAVGFIHTGLLTYGVGHRDAKTILSESPSQQHFDNIKNAWAAVRIGENERGIWFSGVVLPKVDEDDLTLIAASGQVSGEWKHGALRACLTVNVPGFPVVSASAEYDEDGNVLALAASAFGSVDNGTAGSDCDPVPTPLERIQALAAIDAEIRIASVKQAWGS